MLEKIKENAQLVISVAKEEMDLDVGFSREGVEWLDDYLNRQHRYGDPGNTEGLVQTLGAYFGECIKHSFGGYWAEADSGWYLKLNERKSVFPFSKVKKHLEYGSGESVLSMFDTISSYI